MWQDPLKTIGYMFDLLPHMKVAQIGFFRHSDWYEKSGFAFVCCVNVTVMFHRKMTKHWLKPKEDTEWDSEVRDHLTPIFNPILNLSNLNQHTAATTCILAEVALTHSHFSFWQKCGAMKTDVFKVFILASTIRNRANLSCAYVMWWRIKLYTHAKIPCEMYIRIFIAERLSITEKFLTSFFSFVFFGF